MKFWLQPCCSTRRIEHQLLKAVLPYATYKVECTIEGVKNDGRLVNVKGMMKDLAEEIFCITKAEMIDLAAFGKADDSWW
mmetsp:Transcript_27747/g.62734  ORF Transcript_27747/g.62734 Transcript_27747/m.62734 type:complete len:80 (+) Transcript_27747:1-240(+)